MKVENYKKENVERMPSLLASFNVRTEKLVVRGLKVIRGKEGKPWFVGLPSIKQGNDWVSCFEFVNSEHQRAFLQAARDAVQSYVESAQSKPDEVDEEIPF